MVDNFRLTQYDSSICLFILKLSLTCWKVSISFGGISHSDESDGKLVFQHLLKDVYVILLVLRVFVQSVRL